jgi:hypothetical protein
VSAPPGGSETNFTEPLRSRRRKRLWSWHDGHVLGGPIHVAFAGRARTASARALAGALIALAMVTGPLVVSIAQAATAPPTVPATTDASSSENDIGTNPFIPENANIGDCISALPGPDCGTKAQSGYHQYLIFVALILGLGFIGWRVGRSVRARERADTATAPRG